MNYDIIILCETWLNSSILSSELFDDRFVVYRRDRETSNFRIKKEGGGVLIAVSKKKLIQTVLKIGKVHVKIFGSQLISLLLLHHVEYRS